MGEKKKKHEFFWEKPWTQNRLLSRKLMLATFVILVLIASDLAGHPMTEPTIGALRDLVIAYLAVQGIVDYRKFKSTDNIIKDMEQALLSEETTEKGEY